MSLNKNINSTMLSGNHKYLWFLTLSYSMVIVLANWFVPRLIHIAGLDTDGGTLILPLTFILSDLMTEVYGYKYARRAIWCGFLFNFIFLAYGQLIIHLPSPSYPNNNDMFNTLLAANTRIIFASTISYFCSVPLNSFLMAKLKIKTQGRLMGVRFITSTIVASGIDSLIFITLAFYGVMNNHHLVIFILTMWFIKIAIEVIALPFSIYFAKRLKKAEKIDIYDKTTRFNVFSINTDYTTKDNEFSQK